MYRKASKPFAIAALLLFCNDDPDLLKKCEKDEHGRIAYEFYPGYAFYWRVIREKPGAVLELMNSYQPTRIAVLFLLRP
jgi:hypothetical protein